MKNNISELPTLNDRGAQSEFGAHNLIRMGVENDVRLKDQGMNVQYALYKIQRPLRHDPTGTPIDVYYLYIPTINMIYEDTSEEKVFEALHECYQEDFILYMARELNRKRLERDE